MRYPEQLLQLACSVDYVRKNAARIAELRSGIAGLDSDERYLVREEIEEVYRDTVAHVTKKLKNDYMLKYLLSDIDGHFASEDTEERKFYWILFECLCLEKGRRFYNMLSGTRDADMYDLVPDVQGEEEIYGIKHVKKRIKSARI